VEDQSQAQGTTPNASVSTGASTTWLMSTVVFRAANSYTTTAAYDDAGNLLSQGYPDGETVTNSLNAQGWLSGVSTSQGGTTLPGGTDNQAFCYDEQDRLTWAGSTGTPPCTGTAITAGTLTAAQYGPQLFAYDTMGRLTSGPLGAYAWGDAAHKHAATSVGS